MRFSKKVIIITFLIILICVLFFGGFWCQRKRRSKKNYVEDFVKENKINLAKRNLLSRSNLKNYLNELDSGAIKIIDAAKLENESKAVETYANDTIVFVVDDEYNSSDLSNKNYNDFLNNENIKLCVATDWLDKDHQKLFIFPIGFESRLLDWKELKKERRVFLKLLETQHSSLNQIESNRNRGSKILCDAHFNMSKSPSSGFRADRVDLMTHLKGSAKITFLENRLNRKEYFENLKNYSHVLCPEGNGLDTHRFYEGYALGLTPIVRRGPLTGLHSTFPGTVVVEEWGDLLRTDLPANRKPTDLGLVTLGHWLYKSLAPVCRIMTFFTGGNCDEWRNFLVGIRRLNLDKYLVVFVLDRVALECVKKENVSFRTDLMTNDLENSSQYGKLGFKNITEKKLNAIEILLREHFFVFYFDTDIVLFRDPLEHYFSLPPGRLYMQSDKPSFEPDGFGHYCTGVMFAAPCAENEKIFRKSARITRERKMGCGDDQSAVNDYCRERQINIKTLDPAAFPNGWRYFESTETRDQCWKTPVLIHNNYIIGSQKIERFKKNNLWFI